VFFKEMFIVYTLALVKFAEKPFILRAVYIALERHINLRLGLSDLNRLFARCDKLAPPRLNAY
jgi:hypothetical protein